MSGSNTPAPGAAGSRTFAILGDPVAHSRSPAIHNAAFAACGVDARYRTLRVDARRLGRALRALAEAGGGGNVTVPHKESAVRWLDRASDAVRRTGAVNTFWGAADGVCGDNTDVAGFREAAAFHGIELAGCHVLVIGAGGAAAAVLSVLLDAGSRVTLVNRTPARAAALAARLAGESRVRCADRPPRAGFDLIVNATSLGLGALDPHPLGIEQLPPGAVLFDLVYLPGGTSWVRDAARAGFRAYGGGEMLLRQAAAAFTLWTGLPAPLEVMRRALQRAG